MLTSIDIQNLIEAQKGLFVTKEELVTLGYNLDIKFDELLKNIKILT